MSDFEDLLTPKRATHVEKGWGISWDGKTIGEIWAWQKADEKPEHKLNAETVKILYMAKTKKLSLHFHQKKEEVFCCALGSFFVETIEKNGKKRSFTLQAGDRIFIPRCTPHRMTGTSDTNILIEISTHHEDSDSFRIEKGD